MGIVSRGQLPTDGRHTCEKCSATSRSASPWARLHHLRSQTAPVPARRATCIRVSRSSTRSTSRLRVTRWSSSPVRTRKRCGSPRRASRSSGEGATIVPPASPEGFKCLDHGALAFGICVGPKPDEPGAARRSHGAGLHGEELPRQRASSPSTTRTSPTAATPRSTTADTAWRRSRPSVPVCSNNTASGSEEANFYLGDSPGANALVRGNSRTTARLGIFIRNSEGLKVREQRHARQLCRTAGARRRARPGRKRRGPPQHDSRQQPRVPAGEEGPPFSGIGVALLGAHDVTIQVERDPGQLPRPARRSPTAAWSSATRAPDPRPR